LNTVRNQRIDNVSLMLNKMLKVRRTAYITQDELVSRPNGIIMVDQPDVVTELQFTDVTSGGYNEENIIKNDMDNTLATPAVARGATADRAETATEVVTKNNNAGARFDVKIMLFECMGIKRMAMLMDLNNQQFIEEPRLVQVYGEDTFASWDELDPRMLIGEFDYRPSGSNIDPAANKEMRRQQLTQLVGALVQLSQQFPFVDLYELVKEWLESFDIRNVSKILKPKSQVEAEQMQQQMLQLVMAGQAAAGQQMPGAAPGSQPPPDVGAPPAQAAPNPAGGGEPVG
jgi:hypothetical protein